MRTTVGRTYRFRAVHSLPESFGEPWCFPHEHDYTVHVEAKGGTLTDELDAALTFLPLPEVSTVENIAQSILEGMSQATSVTVWEDHARWGRAER